MVGCFLSSLTAYIAALPMKFDVKRQLYMPSPGPHTLKPSSIYRSAAYILLGSPCFTTFHFHRAWKQPWFDSILYTIYIYILCRKLVLQIILNIVLLMIIELVSCQLDFSAQIFTHDFTVRPSQDD